MATQPNVERRVYETYIAVIRNSVGSTMFSNFYASVDGVKTDVMNDGQTSCAFYVSSVLTMLGLMKRVHATVDATIKDLEESGWSRVRETHSRLVLSGSGGDILVWEAKEIGGRRSRHFYIGNGLAVSNNFDTRTPQVHDDSYNGTREIEAVYFRWKF